MNYFLKVIIFKLLIHCYSLSVSVLSLSSVAIISSIESGNVELASSVIPVKDYTLSNITINTLQAVITGLIIMIAVPILLIIIGIVVWAMRRKK